MVTLYLDYKNDLFHVHFRFARISKTLSLFSIAILTCLSASSSCCVLKVTSVIPSRFISTLCFAPWIPASIQRTATWYNRFFLSTIQVILWQCLTTIPGDQIYSLHSHIRPVPAENSKPDSFCLPETAELWSAEQISGSSFNNNWDSPRSSNLPALLSPLPGTQLQLTWGVLKPPEK